jgi:hypothetical protein
MTDPTNPPCLSDEPLPAAVREADAMLGLWAEAFRLHRITYGVEGAMEMTSAFLRDVSAAEVRDLLNAALIRLADAADAKG